MSWLCTKQMGKKVKAVKKQHVHIYIFLIYNVIFSRQNETASRTNGEGIN